MKFANGVILTSEERDRSWGLYSTFAAKMRYAPGEKYPRGPKDSYYRFSPAEGRILQEYQITYISEGKGTFRSATLGVDKPVTLSQGSLFILFPGEWHSYSPDPHTGWCEWSIGFNGTRMDELVGKGFAVREHPVLDVTVNDTIGGLFADAIRVAMEQHPGHQQVLAGLISNIISYALYLDNNRRIDPTYFEKTVTAAKVLIQEEFRTISPKLVAERLGLGYSNFRGIFKKYTGTSPAKYILDIKIIKAKELLSFTDLPVKEISFMIGLDNFDYFSTMFKARTGFSPLAYRSFARGEDGK